MTFWLKNLHRTLGFYVTTFITAILYLPFWQEQHLMKNEPHKTQENSRYNVFSIEAGSTNRYKMSVSQGWRRQRKGNSICMNIRDGVTGCSLVVRLVIEAKWWGQHIVQIIQDGTGQHEKVQLHFWGLRWGKGNCIGASVTWSPHSLGRSHHQTLHSRGHLSSVLSNRHQVRRLSSSSFLCFAIKEKDLLWKIATHFNHLAWFNTQHCSSIYSYWVTGLAKLKINQQWEFINNSKSTHFFLFLFFTK